MCRSTRRNWAPRSSRKSSRPAFLKEIKDALDRIEQGTYGRREYEHREISRERLEALSFARYCIRCARRFEGRATA
jgi:RNA polymerase-binding transcription factor DksA